MLMQPYVPPTAVAATATSGRAQYPSSILYSIAAVATCAVIAVGAIIITQSSGSGEPVVAAAESERTDKPEERVEESETMSARRIAKTMRAYATAFTNSDRGGLSQLFTPNVQRWGVHGPSPDPCYHDVGRSNVLDAYSSQFANVSSYVLNPTDPGVVELTSGKRARARTNYEINGGAAKPIKFSFERSESAGWRISRVVVGQCE